MFGKSSLSQLICLAALSLATLSVAGIPDPIQSTATTAAPGLASVYSAPDGGTNYALNNCRLISVTTDATITLTVRDSFGVPVVNNPKEDMWLESEFGGIIICNNGTTADMDTDPSGQTTFSQAVFIGGGSTYLPPAMPERTIVVINGVPLAQPGLDIVFNTGDLTGDGMVGVSDTVLFKQLYVVGVYSYSIDYYFDGVITLSDLVLFANSMNTTCPQ